MRGVHRSMFALPFIPLLPTSEWKLRISTILYTLLYSNFFLLPCLIFFSCFHQDPSTHSSESLRYGPMFQLLGGFHNIQFARFKECGPLTPHVSLPWVMSWTTVALRAIKVCMIADEIFHSRLWFSEERLRLQKLEPVWLTLHLSAPLFTSVVGWNQGWKGW